MTDSTTPVVVPRSVGLLSRRSITGAIVVSAVALFYIVAVPAIQRAADDNPFVAGQPYTVFDGRLQVTPQAGWELGGDGQLFVTLSKAGATLVMTPPAEPDGPVDDFTLTITGLESDTASAWSIGEVQRFTTDAGDEGAYLVANSASTASVTWKLSDGGRSVVIIGQSPSDLWGRLQDEMDAMVRSVVFVGEGA